VIRWGAPHLLYLLLAVPALLALLAAGAWLKRRDLKRLADPELVPRLTASRSPRLAATRTALLVLGLALAILAAARPQWGEKLQVYKGRGIDVVIALDASKSMLATDVRPDRLSRAKTEIASLLDQLSTNQVGVVAFAGDAHVMCPLTPDVEAAKLFLDIIDPGNMPRPGTNIQSAVETAASLFDPRQQASKALLLVTDGDNLEGDPGAATARAAREGIRIFAVGVGTLEGSTVPESGASGTSYKKDEKDQVVISRLAERLLLVMAKATGGRYFRSESVNLDALALALDQMQKKQIAGGEYVEYEERYQAFLLAAFLLTFAGLLLSDRRGSWFDRRVLPRWRLPGRRPGPGATAGLLLALALLPQAARAGVGPLMREGLGLERKGRFEEALRKYQEALVLEPDDVRIHYDQGRALYRLNRHPEAIAELQLGLLAKDRRLRARSLYNIGNAHFRQGRLDAAIVSYSQALLLDPKDLQAKQNLEYCWKMKAQPPDSTKQQKQQPQQQPQSRPQQPQPAQAQPRKGEIGRDQAERMLQALQGREREDMKKQQERAGRPAAGGKDW
jgi:Ca-activated chloride channel homolog